MGQQLVHSDLLISYEVGRPCDNADQQMHKNSVYDTHVDSGGQCVDVTLTVINSGSKGCTEPCQPQCALHRSCHSPHLYA